MNWNAISTWAAIVLLIDAAVGLWNHERFAEWAPKINVLRIAWIEAAAAALLLLLRFLF